MFTDLGARAAMAHATASAMEVVPDPALLQERQGNQQWSRKVFSHGSDDWAFQEMEHQL